MSMGKGDCHWERNLSKNLLFIQMFERLESDTLGRRHSIDSRDLILMFRMVMVIFPRNLSNLIFCHLGLFVLGGIRRHFARYWHVNRMKDERRKMLKT